MEEQEGQFTFKEL